MPPGDAGVDAERGTCGRPVPASMFACTGGPAESLPPAAEVVCFTVFDPLVSFNFGLLVDGRIVDGRRSRVPDTVFSFSCKGTTEDEAEDPLEVSELSDADLAIVASRLLGERGFVVARESGGVGVLLSRSVTLSSFLVLMSCFELSHSSSKIFAKPNPALGEGTKNLASSLGVGVASVSSTLR